MPTSTFFATTYRRFAWAMLFLFFGINTALADTWDGTAITAPTLSGSTYTIATCANLAWVAQQVNNGNKTFSGYTLIVTDDLDLANHSWTPIGYNQYSWKPFEGTFDGQGHTISNVSISIDDYPVGFFGEVEDPYSTGNSIKNVKLQSVNIIGSFMVGGLVGVIRYSNETIQNCSVTGGTVTSTSSYNNIAYTGGLIGKLYSNNATVTGCSTDVTVNASYLRTGGLIGYMYNGSVNSCSTAGNVISAYNSVGGLVGYLDGTATIANSYATGNVNGVYYVGGLVGYSNSSSSTAYTNSYATGNVIGSGNYIGGFVGYVTAWGVASSCFATGAVQGASYVGGFVGDCYQSNNLINCYATGSVTGTSNYTGGFVGYVDQWSVLTSCYAAGIVKGTSSVGGFVGYCNAGKFNYSYAAGNVTGSGSNIKGFMGAYNNGPAITNCYFDTQGTGQTLGGYASITGETTSQLCALAISGFTNTTGYYPQLTAFYGNGNSVINGWSSLSAVPLNLGATTENTNNINLNFTAPVLSAPNSNSTVTWSPNYQPSDTGRMNFVNGGIFWLTHRGTASFIATDASARVKNFFIFINSLPFARYFVNGTSGTDNNCTNGINWTTPYKTLQYALDQRIDTTQSIQVWVAKGTYTPSRDTTGTATTGAASTFTLKNKIAIYGGFAGNQSTEYSLSEPTMLSYLNKRNIKNNASIITSNPTASNSLINYRINDKKWNGALIDGFTITSGGDGINNYSVKIPPSDTIKNCKIINNATSGLQLQSGAKAFNVLIADNSGIGLNFAGTSAKVVNATIANNSGVGINCSDASNSVTNSILWGNSANLGGSASPVITYSAGSSNYVPANWSTGTGNIDLLHRSPNFKNPNNNYKPNRNYELLLISPCLSQGLAAANTVAIDANGNPRKYGTTIDMGAFEKWDGVTASGSTVSNVRTGTTYASPYSTLSSAAKDSLEICVQPNAIFNMGGNTNLKAHWLELMQDSVSTDSPAQLTNGKIIADSVLYARCFLKMLNGGSGLKGVWNFFGVPFNTAAMATGNPATLTNTILDGALDENTVRIETYNEYARAVNGVGYAWAAGRLSPTSSLTQGKGYALSFNSKIPRSAIGQTVIFSSPSSQGSTSPVTFDETSSPTQPVTLTETPSATSGSPYWYDCGWNLIANPLPQTAGVNNTWGSTPYYGAAYFYKQYTDSYNVVPATALKTGTGNAIAPNGAFFVQTDLNPDVATFTAGTGTGTVLQSMAYVRPSSSDVAAAPVHPATFQFNVTGGGDYCNTYVIFDPRAHAAMEPMEDNPTMVGVSARPALQLSTTATGSTTALAINRLPFTDSTKEVPMQVYAPTAGSYTITMPESDTIASTVLLQDASGALHDLTTGGYTFTTTADGVTNNYTLIFGSTSTGTQVVKGITILQDHRNVIITADSTLKQVALYGVGGQVYYMQNPNSTQLTLQLPAAAGVYLLKIITPQGVITKKMISR